MVRLARAGRADERDLLAPLRVDVTSRSTGTPGLYANVDVLERERLRRRRRAPSPRARSAARGVGLVGRRAAGRSARRRSSRDCSRV